LQSQIDNIDSGQNRDSEILKFGKNKVTRKDIAVHGGLFVLTLLSVTYTGVGWVGRNALYDSGWYILLDGALFALLLLAFLGVHEFGHYFAAVKHNIKTTLPYFIPIPIMIGTMGAVIRIKEQVSDSKKLFDIGISGPLAGFVVSLIVLLYGFSNLPEPDYIMNFTQHEQMQEYVNNYGTYPDEPFEQEGEIAQVLVLGNTLLYSFIASFFDNVPPMWEMYHYPFLFAGWLGLFFTALNLTPVGQLDGGHILYALIGYKKHQVVARIFYIGLMILGGTGLLQGLMQFFDGYSGQLYSLLPWAIWAVILQQLLKKAFHKNMLWVIAGWIIILLANILLLNFIVSPDRASGFTMWFVWGLFVTFLVGVEHPPVMYERQLDPVRTNLGWLSMAIFVVCISPNPMYIIS